MMTGAGSHPPTSPSHGPGIPLDPEPLEIEWESEGFETLDIIAWQASRSKKKAPFGKKRAVAGFISNILYLLFGVAILLIGVALGSTIPIVLGAFLVLVSVLGLVQAYGLINPEALARRMVKTGRKNNLFESTAGHWRCVIGQGHLRWEWLDRGHFSSFPSSEITEVAIVHDRAVLLAGPHVRGHFPVSALSPGDPVARVWSALRHEATALA